MKNSAKAKSQHSGKFAPRENNPLYGSFNGNNLQNADALSTMLQNTAIEELYIHGNNLNTSTAISIFKASEGSSQLKTLSLMHNNIQDEASDKIASTLQVNKSLDALWLNSNPLSEKAALKIVQALHSNNTQSSCTTQ